MNNKIILLNGPAGSGKDTIGRFLVDRINNSSIYKFAEPIKDAVAAFLNLSSEERHYYFETQEGKNNPSPRFFGHTPRKFLIDFSETYAKTLGGKDVFGKILATKLQLDFTQGLIKTAVVTDSGFLDEAEAVLKAFPEDYEVYLFRLHRNNCSFLGDSRSHISLFKSKASNVEELDIENEDGNVEKAVNEILEKVQWDAYFELDEDHYHSGFGYDANQP